MEGPVNGIRETFYHDLTEGYLADQTGSFLYRTFWSENMKGLLKTHFPELLEQDPPALEDAGQLRRLMSKAMKERPEWAQELPARKQSWKLRRNFWEELWLNDAGYRAKLITDTEYYLWLVRYLAVHDVYYKTNIYHYDGSRENKLKRSGHPWLYKLLCKGLGMEDLGALKREIAARKKARREARRKGRKKAGDEGGSSEARAGKDLSRADVEEALAMLAEQIQSGRDTVAARLHGLKDIVRTKDGTAKEVDHLLRLTARLERMALHIKIRNWLQDSGYPLVGENDEGDEPPKGEKKPRRSDSTMRLFEAYCGSAEGYEFRRKSLSERMEGDAAPGDWRLDGTRFCVLCTDGEQLDALLAAHEKEQVEGMYDDTYLYLPLAVHLQSGCVFFLAGKAYYEEVYRKAGGDLQAKYRGTKARYCFDYLRQDPSAGARAGSFRLTPSFHDNVGKRYREVLDDFKGYCEGTTRGGPLHAVRKYNGLEPCDIPDAFCWAFDI